MPDRNADRPVPAARSGRTAALVAGLTGGIGSGKTTVAGLLAGHGAIIVDCDALGRQVVEPGGRAYAGVIERFGPGVVAPDGRIDRPALAAIVFTDPAALADLNRITHPAIDAEIAEHIRAAPAGRVVVLDMAVLVESELGKGQYDVVVVVEAPVDVRIDRLAARGLTAEDARARIAAQTDDAARRAVADFVVANDADQTALAVAVDRLWADLRQILRAQGRSVQARDT